MNRFIVRLIVAALLLGSAACTSQAPGGEGGRPVIARFGAAPASVAPGGPSTLSWQVTGATSLRLEPGVGEVTGSSFTVTPSRTTEYTLIASNANGESRAKTIVTVSDDGGGGGDAEPLHDTIAYATGNGDEIRLINPDGSSDRALWAHGQADPHEVYAVWNISWKPDATELAFASTHENWCSLFNADIFALHADGQGYRRVTQAPACAELATYPQGAVRVPVENSSFDSFSGFLYFQGASGIQAANLPPGGSGVVTFENVADFGDGEDWLQVAAVIYGQYREILFSSLADVQGGGVVTTAEVGVFAPGISWEAFSPSWRADGSSLGFIYNGSSLYQLPPAPEPLEFGAPLLAEDAVTPDFIGFAVRGPTAATATQLLLSGSVLGDSRGVYLSTEGSAAVGEPLVTYDFTESIFGLAWLPDGSGFVYAVTEGDYFGEDRSSNLFVYDFASGESTRVTSLSGDFAGQVAVSPDGQRFAFERATELDEFGASLLRPDLWLVGRDGSGLELLVEDAYAPAWSW